MGSAQKSNSEFQVGIHYVFEQDELDQIYGQVGRIHDLGFDVIELLWNAKQAPSIITIFRTEK